MTLRSKLSSLREYLTPINNESNFESTGEISPDEFVTAGDFLVFKFPTWQWGTCPPELRKSFLPPDKQFLVTRHVPSYRRVSSYIPKIVEEGDHKDGQEDWEMPFLVIPTEGGQTPMVHLKQIDDLDDLIEDSIEDAVDDVTRGNNRPNTDKMNTNTGKDSDEIGLESMDGDGFTNIENFALLTRKYDLYISYSTSYRVPKLYLVGFNANGIPLLPKQMYEDISGDYKDKTATIESLPMSYNTTSVLIHPCKHSSVMKVFMKHSRQAGPQAPRNDQISTSNATGLRVDQYLVIFLKFIASVTPGIEYDFTMDAL